MEWIKCSERLPELKDDSVIAYFENGSIETIHIQDWFADETAGVDNNGVQLYSKQYEWWKPAVTHWMELPQPPREDGTDE